MDSWVEVLGSWAWKLDSWVGAPGCLVLALDNLSG